MSQDPGLQPERTVLAWWRTALSACVGVAGLLRLAPPATASAIVAAGALGGAGLVMLIAARARTRVLHGPRPAAPSPIAVLCLAGALAGTGFAALLLTIVTGTARLLP